MYISHSCHSRDNRCAYSCLFSPKCKKFMQYFRKISFREIYSAFNNNFRLALKHDLIKC